MEGNTTTGPSTFAEAFAADASSASTTSETPQGAVSASADATVPPAADGASPDGQPQQPAGEPPKERWPDILNNQRKAAKEEALAEWRQQYGWAEQADRAAIEQAVKIGQLYSQDRAGYIRQILAEAAADQALAPIVRSEAARLLSQGRGQQAAAPVDLQPIPLQLEDGRTLPLYTAEQLTALKQQWADELRKEFQPAMQTAEQLKAAQEQYARQQEAQTFATSTFGELSKRANFKELQPQIAERLAKMQLTSDHPAEVRAAAFQIYLDLVEERRTGDLQKAQSQLLDNLQQKAAASTSPNPGSAAPSTPKRITSFNDPALTWS